MDLNQEKLTKIEWEGTEKPVSVEEKEILELIIKGYNDVNLIYNKNLSLLSYLKLTPSENMMDYLYQQYFQKNIITLKDKYEIEYDSSIPLKKKLSSGDQIKLNRFSTEIDKIGHRIFEYYLLHVCEKVMKYYFKDKMEKFNLYYYTLFHLRNINISHKNTKVMDFIEHIINEYKDDIDNKQMFSIAHNLIERNKDIYTYADIKLYSHQKELFTVCKNPNPKLILYIAPTGTGKTLSPLGLSEKYKIIFVCAARHVGLALAKSAISVGKKIAFAFGCNTVEDIRLHYFAAKECIRDKRSGRIRKVDNSVGDNVEIMICDIKSYLHAMYYMNAFNDKSNIILYWDEPTISMDYQEHEFHKYISDNWQKNIIPNVILSSATLPHEDELTDTIMDFKSKFENSEIYNITSHDCNKSIPIVNLNNYVELPHYKYEKYSDLQLSVSHCNKYKTLLRYFDLSEIVKFISYVDNSININTLKITNMYEDLSILTMNNIKLHYLKILHTIEEEQWPDIYNYFNKNRTKKYESNINVATKDSHTLTDGPTIFLSENVEKIANFILQSVKIPEKVLSDMDTAIQHNDKIIKLLDSKERELEDSLGDEIEKENKMSKMSLNDAQKKLKKEIDALCNLVKTVQLNDLFVPNKLDHLNYWTKKDTIGNEFSCDISPKDVEKIMLLDVYSKWKVLLLMGIGVFTNNHNSDYTEIMKQLAMEQKLYLIIASSDYIYGTNYQFCHGYISKDLNYMTQEKTIQALGRIGRNQINKDYSIRFRDDSLINKIFTSDQDKPEVTNMNILFNTPI